VTALIDLKLFGQPILRVGGRATARFPTRKTACLCAWLALRPDRSHSRESLIEMLWPEVEPDSGRNRLSTALSAIRAALAQPGVDVDSVLVADRFSVRLKSNAMRTDVREFEKAVEAARQSPTPSEQRRHLDTALRLSAEELLHGFYEDWVVEEQLRIASIREELERAIQALPQQPPASGVENAQDDSRPARDDGRILLPAQFSRFFGRAEEIDWIRSTVADPSTRLVSITGFAGSGKTRTSVEAATVLGGAFPGTTMFVDAAPLTDASQIPVAILQALVVTPSPGEAPIERAARELDRARSLLILDNMEHLVPEGAEVVRQLLEMAANLTVLATSRRSLGLSFEIEYPLGPLPLPGDERDIAAIQSLDSVRLFVDRAQRVRPDFRLRESNVHHVAAICKRLDGIPLALELAAARAQVLTAGQILDRLEERLGFLVSRRSETGDRHRSLKAAIDWSYDMLQPALQRFFCSLSVFVGGWTLGAAEAVCGDAQALDLLEQLHEASLVVVEETDQGIRFRMPETFREYGAAMQAAEAAALIGIRHAEYFASLLQGMRDAVDAGRPGVWNEQIDRDYANVLAAISWLSANGRSGSAMDAVAAMSRYWEVRALWSDARQIAASVAARDDGSASPLERARLYNSAGWFALMQGDMVSSKKLLAQGAAFSRAAGDARLTIEISSRLAITTTNLREFEAAQQLHHDTLQLARDLGDRPIVKRTLIEYGMVAATLRNLEVAREALQEGIAMAIADADDRNVAFGRYFLGATELFAGNHELAKSLALDSLEINERLQDRWGITASTGKLGIIALYSGDNITACRMFASSLPSFAEMRNLWGLLSVLEHSAYVLAALNPADPEPVRLLAGADAAREKLVVPQLPWESPELETRSCAMRAALGDTVYDAAWAEGRQLGLEEITELTICALSIQ